MSKNVRQSGIAISVKRPDSPQPLTLTEAIIPVASLILLVALSYFLFGDAGAVGPEPGRARRRDDDRRVHRLAPRPLARVPGRGRDREASATGIGAIFILFAVGALIGTWAMSGTLVAMVYYGLQLLSPNYFYVTACAICAIVAASIGSSWTVVGTIGVGFMGIAASMDLNPAIAAGAVISGAYFGDKSSPLSDSANLAAAAAGVDLYQHIRETLLTSSVALAISLAVFFMLGQPGDFDATAKMAAIKERVPHLAAAVPAAGRGRRARRVQGPAVHRDLPRRARRRPARRDSSRRSG